MTITSEEFQVEVAEERVVRASLDQPQQLSAAARTIVFIPGFKGFKDWGGWPWLCRELASGGHRVVRINPSMCGVGESLDSFDQPERFARQTLGHDIEDVERLMQHAEIPDSGVLLLGHSRGGLVASLAAPRCAAVEGVITMGAPDNLVRLTEAEVEQWRERGLREVVNARTGEVLHQDVSVLEDYQQRQQDYDAPAALKKAGVPVLAFHGDADEAVETDCARQLLAQVDPDLASRVLVEGAGHTFGLVHPFAGPHPHANQVIEEILRWIGERMTR